MLDLSNGNFIYFFQKIIQDHPDSELFKEPLMRNWEKRSHSIDKSLKYRMLYSFGKFGIKTTELEELANECLASNDPFYFITGSIYMLSIGLAKDMHIELIVKRCLEFLSTDISNLAIKDMSKILSLLQSLDLPSPELLTAYEAVLKSRDLLSDTYLIRSLPSRATVQPLSTVKQQTPYMQSKLAYYLTKGGYHVELEAPLGKLRVDIVVEDVAIEVEGTLSFSSNQKVSDGKMRAYQQEALKHNKRFLVIETQSKDEWSSDSVLKVLRLLRQTEGPK